MEKTAFLFDLDGVIFDTEGQYSEFWSRMANEYFPGKGLGDNIKGQTLRQIFDTYFPDDLQAQGMLTNALNDFESRMDYRYVPGVEQFLEELRAGDYPAAIVTSSNRDKMRNVYRAHPEIKSLFTHIFTGEDFTRSKPAPDCYLLGMEVFGTLPERTFIFEDSFNGLQAAKDSGGKVIALATTNSRQDVSPYADLVIDDFVGMSLPLLFQMM